MDSLIVIVWSLTVTSVMRVAKREARLRITLGLMLLLLFSVFIFWLLYVLLLAGLKTGDILGEAVRTVAVDTVTSFGVFSSGTGDLTLLGVLVRAILSILGDAGGIWTVFVDDAFDFVVVAVVVVVAVAVATAATAAVAAANVLSILGDADGGRIVSVDDAEDFVVAAAALSTLGDAGGGWAVFVDAAEDFVVVAAAAAAVVDLFILFSL